jgi:hypothetical protein
VPAAASVKRKAAAACAADVRIVPPRMEREGAWSLPRRRHRYA